MFGRNNFVETVKAALVETECDMEAFKTWQKRYEKLKKNRREKSNRYYHCWAITCLIQRDAGRMEQILTGDTIDRREFARILKEMKQMRGKFDDEFLVSSKDQEFHSTYDTILRLGVRALEPEDQRILLQSEIENLLELLKENLEKEKPSFEALAFYEQEKGQTNLEELALTEKLSHIQSVYESEFCEPIMQMLTEGIAKANRLSIVCEQSSDRSSKKALAALAVLRNAKPEQIFEQMMKEE